MDKSTVIDVALIIDEQVGWKPSKDMKTWATCPIIEHYSNNCKRSTLF